MSAVIDKNPCRRITILGVGVDDVTEGEAVARIAGFVAAGGPHQIVTVNPEFVMEARRNAALIKAEIQRDLEACNGYVERHGSFADLTREHYLQLDEDDR